MSLQGIFGGLFPILLNECPVVFEVLETHDVRVMLKTRECTWQLYGHVSNHKGDANSRSEPVFSTDTHRPGSEVAAPPRNKNPAAIFPNGSALPQAGLNR